MVTYRNRESIRSNSVSYTLYLDELEVVEQFASEIEERPTATTIQRLVLLRREDGAAPLKDFTTNRKNLKVRTLKLTDRELAQLNKDATESGYSRSSYIRSILYGGSQK